jgi:hypothetical protein
MKEAKKLERFVNDAAQINIEYFINHRHEMDREQQEKFLWRLVENVKECTLIAIEEGL